MTITELCNEINNLTQNQNCGIGLHGLCVEGKQKKVEKQMQKMINDNLKISEGCCCLATISSLGNSTKISDLQQQQLENYSFSHGPQSGTNCNVIIAVPMELQGLYLGFPSFDVAKNGNQFKRTCIFDYVCCEGQKGGAIPNEFILGYYQKNPENTSLTEEDYLFVKNDNFCLLKTNEEQKEFIDKLKSKLPQNILELSDAVLNKDIEKIQEFAKQEEEYNNQILHEEKLKHFSTDAAKEFASRKYHSVISNILNELQPKEFGQEIKGFNPKHRVLGISKKDEIVK